MFDEEKKRRKIISRFLKTKSIFLKNFYYSLLKHRGIYIARDAKIGGNVFFVHPYNIFIGHGAVVGVDCTIYQNVILGAKKGAYPHIGKGCIIYPNAIIVGGVTIGDGTVVGAGSVVTKSFGGGLVIAGNPAKIIKENEQRN